MSAQAGPSTASASTSPAEAGATPAFERWRKSLADFTGMGLTAEERADRDARAEQGKLAKDWDRCEKMKQDLMVSSEWTEV